MLKYSVAVVALLASTSLACAQQADHGSNNGAGMSNSASEHAPGQMKDSGSAKEGGSAKDLTPGQNKGAGNSAKDLAPGPDGRSPSGPAGERRIFPRRR